MPLFSKLPEPFPHLPWENVRPTLISNDIFMKDEHCVRIAWSSFCTFTTYHLLPASSFERLCEVITTVRFDLWREQWNYFGCDSAIGVPRQRPYRLRIDCLNASHWGVGAVICGYLFLRDCCQEMARSTRYILPLIVRCVLCSNRPHQTNTSLELNGSCVHASVRS